MGTSLDDTTRYSLVNHQLRAKIDFCRGMLLRLTQPNKALRQTEIAHPLFYRCTTGLPYIPAGLSRLAI